MTNPYGFDEVEPEFLDAMSQTCRIYRAVAGADEYGMKTTSSTVTAEVPMHAEMKSEDILRSDGETHHIDGKIFLGYIVPWLTEADRIDLPDLAEPSGWKTSIISGVVARSGPEGIHHQEVYFGQRGATNRGMGA